MNYPGEDSDEPLAQERLAGLREANEVVESD